MSVNGFDIRAQIEDPAHPSNDRRQRLNARKANGDDTGFAAAANA